MNQELALVFLQNNQPLLPDDKLTEDTINKYDEVRRFFKKNPCKDSLPLFFRSFGEGDGLGVYQLVEDAILAHDVEDVVPELALALKYGLESGKYWCAQIASNYSDVRLIDGLNVVLKGSNVDAREAAVIGLEVIGGKKVRGVLKDHLLDEQDEDIKLLINEILESDP